MKTNKHPTLPRILERPLLKLVKVLYYRFEFSRGDMNHNGFGTKVVIEYDNKDRRRTENMFPRIAKRDKFLSALGTPTYLSELKRDLQSGGSPARKYLKNIVELTMAPLCPSSSILCSSHLEPFFPSHREVGGRLLDYVRQLFDVQEFLIGELKVKPGSMLPVWMITAPDYDHPLPNLGFIPGRRSLIDALTGYILWELGLQFQDYLQERPLEDRNNFEFFDNALRWGRIATLRHVRENDINERTDEFFLGDIHEKRRIMKNIRHSISAELQTFPLSWANEVLQDIEARGEIAKTVVRKFSKPEEHDYVGDEPTKKKRNDNNSKIVQSSSFISRINRAVKRGQELFEDYRNFW